MLLNWRIAKWRSRSGLSDSSTQCATRNDNFNSLCTALLSLSGGQCRNVELEQRIFEQERSDSLFTCIPIATLVCLQEMAAILSVLLHSFTALRLTHNLSRRHVPANEGKIYHANHNRHMNVFCSLIVFLHLLYPRSS